MPKIGSGWIAYLKTVLFIALRIVLKSKNNFILPFMIIDTPFMGLSNEPDSQEMKMKTGLIKYLYNHQEELGQVILVEKTDQLPNLDIFPNINEMHFSIDSKTLRKGFRINAKAIQYELF